MWIISRIADKGLRHSLGAKDDWDQKWFFANEDRALKDLDFFLKREGNIREYMLVAENSQLPRIDLDQLDDVIPWLT